MKTLLRSVASRLALGLLLLGSCAKNEEQPAPVVSQSKSEIIHLVKQSFLDKGYNQKLFFVSKKQAKVYWAPRWEQASQRTAADSVTYVWVPLEAPAMAWVGVKKYLLVKLAGDKLDFSEATYLFKDKESLPSSSNTRAFFAAFTGTLLLKNLATGDGVRFLYQNGVGQQQKAGQSGIAKKGASHQVEACYYFVTCYWTGQCRTENTTYGTITSGIDNCAEPDPNSGGGGCQYDVIWTMTHQDLTMQCGGGGSDPGNPGDSGNPNDPSNPGGGSSDSNTSLEDKLTTSNTALFGPCPGLTDAWKPLIDFKAPTSVINRLNSLTHQELEAIKVMTPYAHLDPKWQIQSIQDAGGQSINLDRFSVTMSQLPTINGTQLTAAQFLEYIRTNINSFVEGSQPNFTPQTILPGEDIRWQNHELGTVVSIDLPLDDGSVILSDYAQTDWDTHWTFSTLHDPYNGSHPVSGTRTFGIVYNPGFTNPVFGFSYPSSYTFYISGADRILSGPGEMFGALMNLSTNRANAFQYEKSDATWNGVINKVARFVNDPIHGGQPGVANIDPPITNRPNWEKINEALKNNKPFSSIPCN